MRAAAVITGVLAQLEKFLDVEVPGLEVGTDRAFALSALIHRHGCVVNDLEKGYDALRLSVRTLDVGAEGADWRPIVAESAGELRQHGIVMDRAVDAVEIVWNRRQVARRKLRTERACVEQGRGGAHVVEAGKQLVELDCSSLAVVLVDGEAHGHPHEEALRQLQANVIRMEEIAVVERLQAEICELQIALRAQGGAQARQVVFLQPRIQQFQLGAASDIFREALGVDGCHLRLRCGVVTVDRVVALHAEEGKRFATQSVEQQTRGRERVIRLLLHEGSRAHDKRGVDVFLRDAVVHVLQGFIENPLRFDALKPGTCLFYERRDPCEVERGHSAIVERDVDPRALRYLDVARSFVCYPCPRTLFPVENVRPRDLVLPGPHQDQLYLVLDFLDVNRAA